MPVFMKMDGIDSIGPENSAKDGTSNTLMIGEHVTDVGGARGDLWRCGFALAGVQRAERG